MSRVIKFRAWDKEKKVMREVVQINFVEGKVWCRQYYLNDWKFSEVELMQFTGLHDKNGTPIYEGDIVGEEGVYHFIDREGWKPSSGLWKIIGEKSKNFTGKGEEKYIAGYQLKVVEWKDTSCGFEPFSDSEENCHHCGGGKRPSDYEVLGNIYENPELLKGQDAE